MDIVLGACLAAALVLLLQSVHVVRLPGQLHGLLGALHLELMQEHAGAHNLRYGQHQQKHSTLQGEYCTVITRYKCNSCTVEPYRCGQTDRFAYGRKYAQKGEQHNYRAGHVGGDNKLLALRIRIDGYPTDGTHCEEL